MTQILGTSISSELRKRMLAGYSTADILLLIKAYKININVRMMQTSEMYKNIQESIKSLSLNDDVQLENIFRALNRFVTKNSEGIGLSDFSSQSYRISDIINGMERGDISFVESELVNIGEFLNSSLSRYNGDSEGVLEIEIDYEKIVSQKTMIKHKLEEEYGNNIKNLLNEIYLYYTQFWRILEMYGDLYNDLDILLSRERLGDKCDIFFENYFIFQKKYPHKAIKIGGNKIEFNTLTADEKKGLILLYTILLRPGEGIEAITTFCQLYRTEFGLRNTKLQKETIVRDYFSRLNKFLEKYGPAYICQKDKYGFKMVKNMLP